MKTRKFILLNLFIFILSIIACSTTKGTAYRSIMLLDKPGKTAAVQTEVTQGNPPGYTAMFNDRSISNQGNITLYRPPGYTALLKEPPNANALVAVFP